MMRLRTTSVSNDVRAANCEVRSPMLYVCEADIILPMCGIEKTYDKSLLESGINITLQR
jgi:hypothetical protein